MDDMMKAYVDSVRKAYAGLPYPITHETPAYHEEMVEARDGVKLYTYFYLPQEEGRFPVIVQRGCYPAMDIINKPTGEELARRGYAYVFQHCRGTGGSGGEWEPNVNERDDGLDTLNWVEKQPWAGNIGYSGSSYLAMTGWAVADILPQTVKSMFLTNYGVDRYTSAYKDGLMRHDILTAWAMENAGFKVEADYLESCRYRPHMEVDEKLWGKRLEWYRDWLKNPSRTDAYWQTGLWKMFSDIPHGIRVPLFIGDSWYDHHLGSAIFSYEQLPEATKAHTTLSIGSWNHLGQPCLQDRTLANFGGNEAALMMDWFEKTLKREELPPAKIRTYQVNGDVWREWDSWPLPSNGSLQFYLSANKQGAAYALEETAAAGEAGFLYDPENPVPSHGAESMLHTMNEVGSLLQPEPGWRDDVLSFVSAPLEEDVEILGKIDVELFVSTDAGDTAFTAKVMEVFPDGKAYNIRSTIGTLSAQVPGGYTPGQVVPLTLCMWDIDWLARKGSRIRVDVSSSDFPQYVVHTNNTGLWAEQTASKKAQQKLYFGKDHPSRLCIPVRK